MIRMIIRKEELRVEVGICGLMFWFDYSDDNMVPSFNYSFFQGVSKL